MTSHWTFEHVKNLWNANGAELYNRLTRAANSYRSSRSAAAGFISGYRVRSETMDRKEVERLLWEHWELIEGLVRLQNGDFSEVRTNRQLVVETADYWFRNAKDESYSMAERLLFMENALNHTENILRAALTGDHPDLVNKTKERLEELRKAK